MKRESSLTSDLKGESTRVSRSALSGHSIAHFVKTIGIVCLCLVLSAALFGCGGSSVGASSADESEAQDGLYEMDFVLDYTPNTNHTGIYVADALGYYDEAGLSVRVVQPPEDGADALVASGNAQMGMSYQDVMSNYLGSDNPLPVSAVAAVIQHNTSGILSPAELGITSPKDMENKRYATWDQAVEQAIVKSVVESDGGDFSLVDIVPFASNDEIAGFKASMFDSVWAYEAWAGQNAEVQGYPVNYFSFRDIDDRFDFYTPVIIANDDFLASNPERVRAFLEATQRGYLYAAQNPDEAADILVEAVPELDRDLVVASQRYLADKYLDDAPFWGYIDADRWNAFYQWMNEQGLTEKEIPLDEAFTNDYLTK